jgi:hypothetical protein
MTFYSGPSFLFRSLHRRHKVLSFQQKATLLSNYNYYSLTFNRYHYYSFTATNNNNAAKMPHRDHAAFIKQFFATSDTPTAHAEYVENFTQDATLKMGLRTAEGKERKLSFPPEVHTQILNPSLSSSSVPYLKPLFLNP